MKLHLQKKARSEFYSPPADQSYVDNSLLQHASDVALHLTPSQNVWLDSITVSALEVNYLTGLTSSAQIQINAKLDKVGGTLSGVVLSTNTDYSNVLTLVTRKYVEEGLFEKMDKSGGVFTDYIKLHAEPVLNSHAVTKKYADLLLSLHEEDLALHLTPLQSVLLDGVSVSSNEINQLEGVLDNVQTQLNAALKRSGGVMSGALVLGTTPTELGHATRKDYVDSGLAGKYDKAGGTIAGNVVLGNGFSVSVSKAPSDPSELTNKAYVDAKASAQSPLLPILSGNLVSVEELHRPAFAQVGDVYIAGTGNNWPGAAGTPCAYDGVDWIALTEEVITQGARFGVGLTSPTTLSATLQNYQGQVVTLESGTYGSYLWTVEAVESGNSVSVPDSEAPDYGTVYSYTQGVGWKVLTQSTALVPRAGLSLRSQYVDVVLGQGLSFDNNAITLNVSGGMLGVNGDNYLTLTVGGYYIRENDGSLELTEEFYAEVFNHVSLTESSSVSGVVTFENGGVVRTADAPVTGDDLTNKTYVDTQVGGVSLSLGNLTDTVNDLAYAVANPVIPVPDVSGKLDKAGDTMTGPLVLSGLPALPSHASSKAYVDNRFNELSGTQQIDVSTLTGRVDSLFIDRVTRGYVDNELLDKLDVSGGAMEGFITLHSTPVSPMHPTTKQYVDSLAQGLALQSSVRLASSVNVAATYTNGTAGVGASLVGTQNGPLMIDGHYVLVGDRVLLLNQSAGLQNGCYVVQQEGTVSTPVILKRSPNLDESHEVFGSYFYVYDGATKKGSGWVLTVTNPSTFALGIDVIFASQFHGAEAVVQGKGISLVGKEINVAVVSNARLTSTTLGVDLASTGVSAGTYRALEVDIYGRVTAGTNPTTLAGYGITNAQALSPVLTAAAALAGTGLVFQKSGTSMVNKGLKVAGVGLSLTGEKAADEQADITVTLSSTSTATPSTLVARDSSGNFSAGTVTADLTGKAQTAGVLHTAVTVSMTGPVVCNAQSFNGGSDLVLNSSLANTGVAPGAYSQVSVGADGRIYMGQNPTTLAGFGIIDAVTVTQVNTLFDNLQAQIDDLRAYVLARS